MQVDVTAVDMHTFVTEESWNSNTQNTYHVASCLRLHSLILKLWSTTGEDAADQFIETLQKQASDIYSHYIVQNQMIPSQLISGVKSCHICSELLGMD